MGSSRFDDDVYSKRTTDHAAAGTSRFTHSAAVASGAAPKAAHERVDPKKLNKAGRLIREALDSPTSPNSLPIAVLFDVTGSMRKIPEVFVSKLGKTMAALIKKGYAPDPHILFGAIGDATCDRVPLQLGQFEGGNEMDDALSSIYLEGGGGGQDTESYELAMYFMARHTELDSLNKRGKKGYLFLSGDERPYNRVKKSEVEAFIGETIEADIPLATILAELREKFEVFWIFPKGSSYWDQPAMREHLQELFGQNFLPLEDPAEIAELICMTVGIGEGYDLHDVASGLATEFDKGAVSRATSALVPYATGGALAKRGATVEGGALVATEGSGGVSRI